MLYMNVRNQVIMSTYEKDTQTGCPSGLVTQETTTNNNKTEQETQTDFTGCGDNTTVNELIADMHQKGWCRDRLLSETSYAVPEYVKRATLSRAERQIERRLAPTRDPLSRALEQAHTSGEHNVRLPKRRPARTPKHKGVTDKEERQRRIKERRSEAMRARGGFRAVYEGLLDCRMSVDEDTTRSFSELFADALKRLKEAINNNRVVMEHVLKIEPSGLEKLILCISIIAVGSIAVCKAACASTFVKFMLGGITAIGVGWVCFGSIKEFIVNHIIRFITGKDPASIHAQSVADIASCEKEFEDWYSAPCSSLSIDDIDRAWCGETMEYEGMFEDAGPSLGAILTELCAGVVSVITGSLFTGGTKGLGEKIVKSNRLFGDLKFIFGEAMRWVADKVDLIFGTSFSDYFQRNKAIEKWAVEVESYYNKYSRGEVKMTSTTGRRINCLMLRGLELARRYESMDASSWALHRFCTGLINKMESAVGAAGITVSERPVPLVVMLKGESGIGKSYITHGLIDEIALRVLDTHEERVDYANNHSSEKYVWVSEEDHANGYFGQFATIFDDFGQFLTQKGQPDDFIRIIRLANAAPCRLNCAELERKGRVFFTSSLIVLTTNLKQCWGPSLAKNEALVRRFDVVVDMVPRVEFCTEATKNAPTADKRRLDRSKITKKIEYDVCEYRLMRCVDAEQQIYELDRVCTFAELIDHCVAEFNVHKKQHSGLMEALSDRRMELVEQRRDEPEIQYEGFLDWLKGSRPRNLIGQVSQKMKDLIADCKIALYAMREKMRSQSWAHFIGCVLAVLAIVAACGFVISFITSLVRSRSTNDVGEFFDHVAVSSCGAYGCDVKNITDVKSLAGHKRVDKMIRAAQEQVKNKGSITAFGKTLQCKPEDIEQWRKAMNTNYEAAELLCNDSTNTRMYHNTLIRKVLENNVYHMYRPFDDPDEVDSFGKITMVESNVGMMNYHYLAQIRTIYEANVKGVDHVVLVSHKNKNKTFHIPLSWFMNEDNLAEDRDGDIVLIKFSKQVHTHTSILKHFIDADIVLKNRDFDSTLFAARAPRSLELFDVGRRLSTEPIRVKDGTVHTNVIGYEALTQTGDCGSLLAFSGNYAGQERRIFGVHMAGGIDAGRKLGFATIVTEQKLRDLLQKFGPIPKIHGDVVVEGQLLRDIETCHQVVRKIERPVYQPTQTAIVPSLLNGELGPVTKRPARLGRFTNDDGLVVDPMNLALIRQHNYNVSVDEDLLEIVVQDVYKRLLPYMKNRGRVLTFEEAVAGTPELPCLGAIPRQTSAGFSYMGDSRVKNGKKEFFGEEGDYTFDTPLCNDLRKRVDRIEALAREGIVTEDRVYTDILKDEPVSLEKYDSGKVRLIAGCDLPMTVALRKRYGAVCNDLVASRIANGIAVGMNPYSREWHVLARHLTSHGKKVVAGDFSGYDNSQSCQLIHAVMRVLKLLAGLPGQANSIMMDVYAVTVAQPYHANGGRIYTLDHGMPSGNPMTSIINSVFGLIAFRLCWLKASRGHYISPSVSLTAFNENVKLVMYGDDNLLGISDEAISFFNQNSMMEHFPAFGLKYTSDKKDDENPPAYRTIEEVTFLKRSFRYAKDVGAYVAPLDKETIVSMLHWSKRGASTNSITLDNCEIAMREWSLHGEDYYNEMSTQLQEAVRRRMKHNLYVAPYKATLADVCNHVPKWVKERS